MATEWRVPASWKHFRMLAQIFIAFGQGTGQLNVSDDALRLAVDNYLDKIEKSDDWGTNGPSALGIARVMGQAAAAHAIRNGRAIVTAEDFAASRTLIHRSSSEAKSLMGGCPWPVLD